MNRQKIALRYERSILVPNAHSDVTSDNNRLLTLSLNAELMRHGFILSQDAFVVIESLTQEEITALYESVLPEVANLTGADVEYRPMYPNFPEQVMNASLMELFVNAIFHYWTFGEWKPEYEKLPREIGFENVDFKVLGTIEEAQFRQIFGNILSSNDSISDTDRATVVEFMDNYDDSELEYPVIPFKENMCFVAGLLAEKGRDITAVPKTTTDVLRIATALSGGDVSLASNTKFVSLPRRQRRMLVNALFNVANLDDFMRHRNKWVRLFHSLHINELTSSVSLVSMVKKVRSGQRMTTFNGRVEAALASANVDAAVALLRTRPGDFARRLSHVLSVKRNGRSAVVEEFLSVADQVSTRVLLQLVGSLKIRAGVGIDKRVVFPKGSIAKAQVIRTPLPKLGSRVVSQLRDGINEILKTRFAGLEPLGKVFVDPELEACPLPAQQRSASEGLIQVGRGTRLPIGEDKNTLRFFIYWVGQDIDLSATLHDENFNMVERIAYTNLRSSKYQACHSGDIVNGRNGASEFIDITMDQAASAGIRYVVMNVLVFSGPNFSEHEKCYAGWMTRSKPSSNEIFDPKTVEQKIDVASECKNVIPVVFDLVERKAIWTDLVTPRHVSWAAGSSWRPGNNVESNRASIEEKLEAIVSLHNKTSLAELFLLHAEARAEEIVEDPAEADIVFSVNEGITPRDITLINSEYLIDEAPSKVESK